MFSGFIGESIIKKSIEKSIIEINLINIRDFAYNKHHVTDDYAFGGGPGMVMKPEPLYEALQPLKNTRVIYMSPQESRKSPRTGHRKDREHPIYRAHFRLTFHNIPEVLPQSHSDTSQPSRC